MVAAYYGLTAAGVILLIWYYIIYCQAERPRPGTLEWIDRYERPRCTLSDCGKPLRGKDALWALLPAFLAAVFSLILQSVDDTYNGMLGALLRIPIGGLTLFLSWETLCAAGAAAAAYLLGRTLTGRTFAALAGALFYAVRPENELFSCLLFSGMLFLWLWAGFASRGADGWVKLLLGALLTGASAFSLAAFAVLPALLVTLFFVSIQRARAEEHGWLYVALRVAAAFAAAVVGFFGTAALCGEWAAIASHPGAWLLSVFAEQTDILAKWLAVPLFRERLIDAPLLFSGPVALLLLWYDRRVGGALYLLFWALPTAILYALFPLMFPAVTAALVCAWLTGRLQERKHPCAAALGAIGGIAIYGLQDLMIEFFNLTQLF